MKILIRVIFFILTINNVNAQSKTESASKVYDAILSFNSICCGAPSATFLSTFLHDYSKRNKVVLEAWHLGGCGREGEFKILVSSSKLKKSKKVKFKRALQTLIPDQNNKNKTLKPSSGNINIAYDMPLSNEDNCTEKLSEWKF